MIGASLGIPSAVPHPSAGRAHHESQARRRDLHQRAATAPVCVIRFVISGGAHPLSLGTSGSTKSGPCSVICTSATWRCHLLTHSLHSITWTFLASGSSRSSHRKPSSRAVAAPPSGHERRVFGMVLAARGVHGDHYHGESPELTGSN